MLAKFSGKKFRMLTASKPKQSVKIVVAYLGLIVLLVGAIWGVGNLSTSIFSTPGVQKPLSTAQESTLLQSLVTQALHNLTHGGGLLMLQILIILLCTRVMVYVFKKIGQPAVIGEIVAGIVLGPSLLGLVFPQLSNHVFYPEAIKNLQFFSYLGLVVFMFILGMEIDFKSLKENSQRSVFISHAGIVIPFVLGIVLGLMLYSNFGPHNVPFLVFASFLGVALSITAFPVLARIIQEKGLAKEKIGTVALSIAAVEDVTAWCILALVVSTAKATSVYTSLLTMLFVVVFVAVMLLIVKPLVQKIYNRFVDGSNVEHLTVVLTMALLLTSTLVTEVFGINGLFGAFVAGLIMPTDERFRSYIVGRVESFNAIFLLPMFFAVAGLKTQIGELNSLWLVGLCLVVIAFATIGKFGGVTIASRISGHSWKDSVLLGTLMNTRGLMELVVLNIGYDLGILNAQLYTVMVVMAIVTTASTGPLWNFFSARFAANK